MTLSYNQRMDEEKKRVADIEVVKEMLMRVLDPSRGKIKKTFLNEMAMDRMKEYSVVVLGLREHGKLTSDLSFILRRRHRFCLKTTTSTTLDNVVTFTGSTTHASILSICKEPWVTGIVANSA